MKSLFMLIVFLFTIIDVFSQTCSTLKVTYEGKTYNTIQIGNQCWLKENLDVGTRINGSKDALDNDKIEKYCYADRESNCEIYGGLYQWNEARGYSLTEGAQGICPIGWHIPTLAEFEALKAAMNDNGNSLKEQGEGIADRESSNDRRGTNKSGFSALLSGRRYYNGSFYHLGVNAYFWSSMGNDSYNSSYLHLYCDNSNIPLGNNYKEHGFSVRCIKD